MAQYRIQNVSCQVFFMTNANEIFSQRLRELRISNGLSQDEIAQKVNVMRATVGHWENGRREPNIQTMCILADLFKVSLDFMTGRSDNPRLFNQVSRRTEK